MAIAKYNISNNNNTVPGAHNSNNIPNAILSTSSTLQKEYRRGDDKERGRTCGKCR